MKKFIRKQEARVLISFIIVCLSMMSHYFFVGDRFNILYFIKEYTMLISFCYVSYFSLDSLQSLLEEHKLLTYINMLTIGLTVIYLTFLVIYFSVAASVKNSEIFKCSNVFWLLLVSASFVVSLVFVATGAIVSTSMKDITRKDLKQKEKNLWVLIGVSVASRMVGLGENIVFILKDYDNCFIYVGNIDLEFVIFSLLKMITDYSVMFTVLYQFQKHDYKDSSSLRSLAMEDLKRPETEENIKTKMQNYFSPIRAKLPKKIPL